MKTRKKLKIIGTKLDKNQLEMHLQKIAANHNLNRKSKKETYPVPHMIENFKIIQEVYQLLNTHLKLGISIHPAGEWLLDNFYIIEETVKQIQKELTLKKYTNFVGIASGIYEGFARIYVLAAEIVAYTDNKIEKQDLEDYLISYQTKKTLSMDEIWNIGIFMQISIIENIKEICEKIASSQIQKSKAEDIVQRLVENKDISKIVVQNTKWRKLEKNIYEDIKYPFIEYMSYILKRYGKRGYSYLKALEEVIERLGTTVSEVIRKEHFDIAVKKVLIGNSITSIKKIQRINFLEIFEKINGVEEILRNDPANVYSKMDNKTKEYYRIKIKEIAEETKISEIYISKQILQLCLEKEKGTKESHIGYYLIDKGINQLYYKLNYKFKNKMSEQNKTKIYILGLIILTILNSLVLTLIMDMKIKNNLIAIISFIVFLVPVSEIVIQTIQYILSKIVKPKLIPKLDFSKGINKENSCMVVIPTIISSKEKVQELMKKLEVFYLANKSENIYFTLLGDCTQSLKKEEEFDLEIIEEGKKQEEILNDKYKNKENELPKFQFIYRKRNWNEKQKCYLGWERKRGLLNQFNEYLLGNIENPFKENTIENYKNKEKEIPKIKYIITLDSDTDLVLNTGLELIGAMAHILNEPIIDPNKNIVIEGYGIMQPRIGLNLDVSYKSKFVQLFGGAGGIDNYTNAISDIYQDNFKEGIFTGKGIYNLEVFSKVLKNAIPENTVLSHDLLEGNYLRCGLVSDIMLMDGYPTKYNSFMTRLARWIRGDWQISNWLNKNIKNKDKEEINPLNLLSKYKIFDNLRRSLLEISIIVAIIYLNLLSFINDIKIYKIVTFLFGVAIFPFFLEILNHLIFKKEGEEKQKSFTPKITGIKGAFYRSIITLGCLPSKAYISIKAIIKTIYRKKISHKNLLDWITSEEAERQSKSDVVTYIKLMKMNILSGIISIIIGIVKFDIFAIMLGILWILTPVIMWQISKEEKEKNVIKDLSKQEKEYVLDIGKRTWAFFEKYLNQENNYLIPDNYQEDRKQKIVPRTSSTNIGLSILAVISAYDLEFITLEQGMNLLENIILEIDSLPKWNGHLYNWYNIKTKEPLMPRYVSTVDSGNFVGYLYVLKSFLEKYEDKKYLLKIVENMIDLTDFSLLYDKEKQIFTIGFNIEENKLTDSYYDLLASEARQASLIAIAKKDVSPKHWSRLSRTLTILNKRKGLISWSGTAFEYLMPNINIPKYKGSLLDESCKFMIMSQMEYAKKTNIPWGISEAAFNLKDLKSNYQYKAFGIPWLGLKRGLADELVVSAYGSILAINEIPKEVIKNLKILEEEGMYNKYGFYESVDYTPERVGKGKKSSVVKTYMAHHQGLILLSINNLLNNNILQKRFMENPEIEAISILLQEKMPETFIITKENKEKIEKLKYKDYENYIRNTYTKIDDRIIRGNVISNENYMVAMNEKGEGISKYKDIYINRYKITDDYSQGIFFNIKNIKNQKISSSYYSQNDKKETKYQISFMPDKNEQEIITGNIKAKIETAVAPNDPAEIRRITIENSGSEEEILEVTSYFEPVLSKKEQDYAHPIFNNLFLVFEWNEETNSLIVKRRKRGKEEKEIFMGVNLSTKSETIGDLEYEIEEEKFLGRGNLGIPNMVKNSIPFSKKVGLVTEAIIALKRTIKVKPNEEVTLDFIIAVGEEKNSIIQLIDKYNSQKNVKATFELSKARIEAESRYLNIKGKEIEQYQKMLSYIIFSNPTRSERMKKLEEQNYRKSELWKYGISGDYPIILVKIKYVNDIDVINQVLKAYEFFRTKNIQTEIVILDEEKHSYENYVREEIESSILNIHMGYLKNIRGGIFNLSKGEINPKDIQLLEFISTILIDSSKGGIENSLKELEEEYLEKYKQISEEENNNYLLQEEKEDINIINDKNKLKYYNEYGGFSEDGKEYLIQIDRDNRLPIVWSNVMANEKFGTICTESQGGYSWYKNSRLNRVTSWQNYPGIDIPSEIIYLKDMETKKSWSLGLNPMPDSNKYYTVYGFGYCKYFHKSDEIEQELEVFVPKEDSCKVSILKLKNTTPKRKKIKLYYYIKPVLGEDEIKTFEYINVKFDRNNNIICAKNLYDEDFNNTRVYVSCSEKIKSYTGDKLFFIGQGGLQNPDGLKKVSLNNENSLGKNSCIVYEVEIEIDSFSNKEISIILGAEDNVIDCKNIAYKYSKISNCKNELETVKKYWKEQLRKSTGLYSY